jgi:hypothetical protein
MTSPFGNDAEAIAVEVADDICTLHRATARRLVMSLPPTLTMCAWPDSLRWLKVGSLIWSGYAEIVHSRTHRI